MKKILSLILALTMAVGLAACGSAEAPAEETTEGTEAGEAVTLTVAATATPHAEILAQVVDVLAEQGITLVVDEYNDYVTPNTAVEEGEVDANFFQHTPYMDQFNADKGTHLVSVAKIHYEPMGIYAGMTASLEELPDGATIAVPNDPTNEARALLLLEAQGLIEVDDAAGLNATPNDITSNPKNLKFVELEAAQIPRSLEDVAIAAINSNYALQASLNPSTDALVIEDASGEAAQTYANILCVVADQSDSEKTKALLEALNSQAVKDYINKTYNGAVLPLS